METELDFGGKAVRTRATHQRTGHSDIVTLDTFAYDHQGRLVRQQQTINGQAQETLVDNSYDHLGQLVRKEVGGGLQTVKYAYNVRGWLTDINDVGNTDKLFNFRIGYNQGTNPLYNGNISRTQWRTANNDDSSLKSYDYTYDALNRIIAATDDTADNRYSLSNVTYDKNGNVLGLTRKGHLNSGATSFGNMDVLGYVYDSGNKVLRINDSGNDAHGFKDGTNTNDDFEYDPNGNLEVDRNKGINSITYNHLNMPTKITVMGTGGGTLDYVYAADRTKLRKVNSNGTTTDYPNGHIYENGNLVQFFHPEGYVEPDGSGSYTYVYQYRDQIENVRLSYADLDGNGSIDPSSEILHERNYFPFGMLHKGYNGNVSGVVNNYKQYQSQEYTEDLGLNIHEWRFRFSDPTIGGRFWSIDPLAEEYSYQSPYNFSENRVIDGFELEGLEYVPINGDGIARKLENDIREAGQAVSSFFNRIGNAISDAFSSRGGNPIYGSGSENRGRRNVPKENAGQPIDVSDMPTPGNMKGSGIMKAIQGTVKNASNMDKAIDAVKNEASISSGSSNSEPSSDNKSVSVQLNTKNPDFGYVDGQLMDVGGTTFRDTTVTASTADSIVKSNDSIQLEKVREARTNFLNRNN